MNFIKSNSYFFSGCFLWWLLVGCVQYFYSQETIIFWVNRHNAAVLDVFFKYLTHLGDGVFYLLVAVYFLYVSFRKGMVLLLAYSFTAAIAQFLKHIVFPDRLRPMGVFEGKNMAIHLVEGVEIHIANSFPSGHTISAFSLALVLSMFSTNKKWGLLFATLAILVAYSRMYLFQHFCVDVSVGSLFGIVLSALIIQYYPITNPNR